jgi:surface polysaccharide O-acyltransferase-like enzyme
MWLMAGAGTLCFAVFFGYDWWVGTANRWTFKRDYILNNHWTPRGASSIWVLGMICVLMPAFYYLAEMRRWRMAWLVTLGRTALVLYFIHQLIVLTLVNQRLGLRTNDWPWYLGANLALLIALLAIGKLWLTVKARIFVKGWRLQYRRTSA